MSEDNKGSRAIAKEQLEHATGNNYACCYQCGKCTAGCPVGSMTDHAPSRVMRLVQTGRIDEALRSNALWYCLGCQTCTARCPQNLEISGTIDALRSMALERGIASADRARKLVEAFHHALLKTVRKSGRLHELSLVNSYKLRTGTFFQDLDAGMKMMLQGKINPFSMLTGGEKVKGLAEVESIFARTETDSHGPAAARRKPAKAEIALKPALTIDPARALGYYPGCSLSGTAVEFGVSSRLMCRRLGLNLQEVDDWNCCGATSAHATNHRLSLLLPARNQVLADRGGFDHVLTPCASCLNRQIVSRAALQESPELRDQIREVMGMEPTFRAEFINPMQLLSGLDPDYFRARVVRPLTGLKLACYYGCLLVRPGKITGFDDPENPTKMEALLRTLGATPVDWGLKVECCGAGLTMAQPAVIEELTHRILTNAAASGAQAFVVVCPLCHSNLDMRQAATRKRFDDVCPMPVYYLTELAAIACGADPVEAAVGKHFVPALELVSR